jgi:hypothetical protein
MWSCLTTRLGVNTLLGNFAGEGGGGTMKFSSDTMADREQDLSEVT